MTNWRAVGLGFLVLLVVALFGAGLPVLGQIGAGLVGGFVAGYVAGGGFVSGAWHGLVAGSITGVVFTAILALAGGLLSGPLAGIVGGGILFVGLALTVLFAVDSALAGAIGGALKTE